MTIDRNIFDKHLHDMCLRWEEAELTRAEERELMRMLANYDGDDEEILSCKGAVSYILTAGSFAETSEAGVREAEVGGRRSRRYLIGRIAAVAIPLFALGALWLGISARDEGSGTFHSLQSGVATENPQVALNIMNSQLDMLADGAMEYSATESEEFIFQN